MKTEDLLDKLENEPGDMPRELREKLIWTITKHQKQEKDREEFAEFKSKTLYLLNCLKNKDAK